jgi:hypothetical protein
MMKIKMDTIEVNREFRRRLRIYDGEPGLATREEVKRWRTDRGTQNDTDMFVESNAEYHRENPGVQSDFMDPDEDEDVTWGRPFNG